MNVDVAARLGWISPSEHDAQTESCSNEAIEVMLRTADENTLSLLRKPAREYDEVMRPETKELEIPLIPLGLQNRGRIWKVLKDVQMEWK